MSKPSLSCEQLRAARDALVAQREEILASVSSLQRDEEVLMASARSGEDRPRNETESNVIASDRHLVAQLTGRIAESLQEVEAALARIEEGTYGVCTGCGQPIPPARLEVRPRTATCVGCTPARR
jgi:RNA polymerase-binding transcription factor DksA